MLVGGVIEILAVLDVPELLNLTGAEVAQIGGAVIICAAAIRSLVRWRAPTRRADLPNGLDDATPPG